MRVGYLFHRPYASGGDKFRFALDRHPHAEQCNAPNFCLAGVLEGFCPVFLPIQSVEALRGSFAAESIVVGIFIAGCVS